MRSSSVGISVSEILSKPVVEAVKGTTEPEPFVKALICTPLADEIAGEEANDEPDHEPCDGPEDLLAHSPTTSAPFTVFHGSPNTTLSRFPHTGQ